jgi:cytoskeletal protein CcmA (bactofilin family)
MKITLREVLAGLTLLAAATNVNATLFLNPDKPDFKADSVYNDDVVLSGGTIKLDSRIEGDLIGFCYEIVESGSVDGNFNVFCYSVQDLGSVGGSLRAFARDISCNAPVGRNFIAFGQEINIGPDAVIGRDAHIFGQDVTVESQVNGNLEVEASRAELSGKVSGKFSFEGNELIIGPNAVIDGDLDYESPEKAEIPTSARITGEVRWTPSESKEKKEPALFTVARVFSWLIPHRAYFLGLAFMSMIFFVGSAIPFPTGLAVFILWFTLLVSGNLLLLFTGGLSSRTEKVLKEKTLPSIGLGFAIMLLIPIVSLILLLTIFFGGMVILLYGAACFVGAVYASLFIGRRICILLNIGSESSKGYGCYSLGVVVLVALSYIPIIGYLLSLLVVMMGLGGLALAIFGGERKTSAVI